MSPRISHSSSTSKHPKRTAPPPLTHAISYHASQITILWIIVIFVTLAGFLVMASFTSRLNDAEVTLNIFGQRIAQLESQVNQVNQVVIPPIIPVVVPTSTLSQIAVPVEPSMSPTGALDRGMLNADGTRYAGYNDTVKGKIGVAVEIVGESRPKYIVLFNTSLESTGKGTPQESQMSVQWKSPSEIEYNVLVKKADGTQDIETRTVTIHF